MGVKRLNKYPCLYAFFICTIDSKMNPENGSERKHRTAVLQPQNEIPIQIANLHFWKLIAEEGIFSQGRPIR